MVRARPAIVADGVATVEGVTPEAVVIAAAEVAAATDAALGALTTTLRFNPSQ
jgi:hypothetical protein